MPPKADVSPTLVDFRLCPTAEVEVHQFVTRYTEGFSHFVTSVTAPIASGRSDSCRVGLAPTEERRLTTAHTHRQTPQKRTPLRNRLRLHNHHTEP